MELQEKIDFNAADRLQVDGAIYSAGLGIEEELAFGGRSGSVRVDRKAVGLGIVVLLVVGGVFLGTMRGRDDQPSGARDPHPTPAVAPTDAAATATVQRSPPPVGSCPRMSAPVDHSAPCPETVLNETCTVRCQEGYGDTVFAYAMYRCVYREALKQPYTFEAVGDALTCGHNPTLPRAPPPPPPPGTPAAGNDLCPPGCRLTSHTASSFFPIGTGTPASDRCACVGHHALSGNLPPPANFTVNAAISVSSTGSLVDLSGSISVHKTNTKEAVGPGADFVVQGVCHDHHVTDFGGVQGATCANETVTCDKAHIGTDPADGSRIRAPQACCKCGGGVRTEDYAISGRCNFDYHVSGTVAYTTAISASGEGLLNLNDGSTVINSCTSQSGSPTECKCADSRLTMQDVNWYASNIPWNNDKLSYSYTKCTDGDRRGPDCEDIYLYDLSDLQNFNRDNSGGAPPVIHYVFRHADGSMVPDISLTRVEGTISAQVTITFTVTVLHQTLEPVPLNSPIYTRAPCFAPPREDCVCHFPFTYKGTTYNQCTQVEEASPWCALEVSGNGDDPNQFEPHRNDWEFCDSPTTCH